MSRKKPKRTIDLQAIEEAVKEGLLEAYIQIKVDGASIMLRDAKTGDVIEIGEASNE